MKGRRAAAVTAPALAAIVELTPGKIKSPAAGQMGVSSSDVESRGRPTRESET